MTVLNVEPDHATFSGYKINWHFEDFEPSLDSGNAIISATILMPSDYFAIQNAQQEVNDNPLDGDAWGRLGKAYKLAGMGEFDFRSDPAGKIMFQKSVEAYQRAVALLPDDESWHYGFAELVCETVSSRLWRQESIEDVIIGL